MLLLSLSARGEGRHGGAHHIMRSQTMTSAVTRSADGAIVALAGRRIVGDFEEFAADRVAEAFVGRLPRAARAIDATAIAPAFEDRADQDQYAEDNELSAGRPRLGNRDDKRQTAEDEHDAAPDHERTQHPSHPAESRVTAVPYATISDIV